MAKGKILKGVGGFYTVLSQDHQIHTCKARGRFRKDGVTPLPGDNVQFAFQDGAEGFIEEIAPRKNELIRPRVANVDMVAIVVSANKPKIDYMLCDKLIIAAKIQGIIPLIVINKCDTATEQQIDLIYEEYRKACNVLRVSALTKEGLAELREQLKHKCTCFAGQSAAGKSSILNALFSSLDLETGGMSKKTDRGKHTTRHAELLLFEDFSGTVVDTPGFSFFDNDEILPENLDVYYDDIMKYASGCKFTSCTHAHEPNCSVKDAVNKGLISNNRYQRYLEILKELYEKRSKKYD